MPNDIPGSQLADRIATFNTDLAKQAPDAVKALAAEVESLVRTGAGSKALKVGDPAPDFTLPDATRRAISLASLRAAGPVVVTFYRGQWCPYCDLQLRAYQEVLPRIRGLGATLVAISPQTPDEGLSTAEKRSGSATTCVPGERRIARTSAWGCSVQRSLALSKG